MISTAIRLARVGSRPELAAALLMVLGYPVPHAGRAHSEPLALRGRRCRDLPGGPTYLHHRGSYFINRLSKVRAGLSIRFLVRELLLILLLARTALSDDRSSTRRSPASCVFYGLQAPHGALLTLIRQPPQAALRHPQRRPGRRSPIPDAPPRWLTHRAAEKMLHLDLAAVAGLLAAAETDVRSGYVGHRRHPGPGPGYIARAVPVPARQADPAQGRDGPRRIGRLAARLPADDGALLLRLQGLRLPGQHVAGDHGAARTPGR